MQQGGKPSGIIREEIQPGKAVDFEGQRVTVVRFRESASFDAPYSARLVLEFDDGSHHVLYGYFSYDGSDEFIEVGREKH